MEISTALVVWAWKYTHKIFSSATDHAPVTLLSSAGLATLAFFGDFPLTSGFTSPWCSTDRFWAGMLLDDLFWLCTGLEGVKWSAEPAQP